MNITKIEWQGFEEKIEESGLAKDLRIRKGYPYLATDCDELALFFVLSAEKAIVLASAKAGATLTGSEMDIRHEDLIKIETKVTISQK